MIRSVFHARKLQSNFLCTWITRCATISIKLLMNDVAWRFSELFIHPTRQTSVRTILRCSDISKENWRTAVCKVRKKISRYFKNYGITSLLRSFECYLNHDTIGYAGSLNMTDSIFINDAFSIWLFHKQVKVRACSHCSSVTLYALIRLNEPCNSIKMHSERERFSRSKQELSWRLCEFTLGKLG
jgi:hypothetical protein